MAGSTVAGSAQDELSGTGPVGQGDYVVQQGDSIASVAFDRGLTPAAIWCHPANRRLKEIRQDPNILLPGDRLTIREKEIRLIDRPTDQRHRFVVLGRRARLRVRLIELAPQRSDQDRRSGGQTNGDRPCANLPYHLKVEGQSVRGNTDADGWIDCSIRPDAKTGTLTLEPGTPQQIVLPLLLGHMDPLSELTGIRKRLRNLGFDCGEIGQGSGEDLEEPLRDFQKRYGLPVTGEMNAATRSKLRDVHGS